MWGRDLHPEKKKGLSSTVKAIIAVPLAFAIVLAGLYIYCDNWPPLVVVESSSMQHSNTTSYIGVIDTGDIVLVQKASSNSDVTTYVQGEETGYSTYGEYGNVIVYDRPTSSTPVIHRAIIYLEYNESSNSFDAPSLANFPTSQWSVTGGGHIGPI